MVHRPVVTTIFEAARKEMSGQKKSEPILKSAMMTRWRRQRCRLRGFVYQRGRGDSLVALQGRHCDHNNVLRARGK